MDIYLNKNLVTEDNLSTSAVLTYVAIRKVVSTNTLMLNKETTTDYISINRLCYELCDYSAKYDKALINALTNGINELNEKEVISIINTYSKNEFVIDFANVWLDLKKDYFVVIDSDDVTKILLCNEVINKKIPMLKYYIALLSTFNHSNSMNNSCKGKVGSMSIQYIAQQSNISPKTAQRYNTILEEKELIYVYRSNDKVRIDGKMKQISNSYSRFCDKGVLISYAREYEEQLGYQHKLVKTTKNKAKADNNRRLGQIYRSICNGKEYDNETINEVYLYVHNTNKSINKKINECEVGYISESTKAYIEELSNKIKDESIFNQFDFIGVESDSQWGESIDFDYED